MVKFFINKSRIIKNILFLEIFIIINIFLLVMSQALASRRIIIIFITISVCEAILGLGILIFISRHKNPEILLLT